MAIEGIGNDLKPLLEETRGIIRPLFQRAGSTLKRAWEGAKDILSHARRPRTGIPSIGEEVALLQARHAAREVARLQGEVLALAGPLGQALEGGSPARAGKLLGQFIDKSEHLASLLSRQGRFSEAGETLRNALEATLQTGGVDRAVELAGKSAAAWQRAGNPERAVALYRRCIAELKQGGYGFQSAALEARLVDVLKSLKDHHSSQVLKMTGVKEIAIAPVADPIYDIPIPGIRITVESPRAIESVRRHLPFAEDIPVDILTLRK